MEFSCRCYSTTGGITSLMLLHFGLLAPGRVDHSIADTALLYRWTSVRLGPVV